MDLTSDCQLRVDRDSAGRVVCVRGPGLVDLQINGYAGANFNGPVEEMTVEALGPCFEHMARRGVGAILATVTTAPTDEMLRRVRRLCQLRRQDERIGRMIAGFHIEGPMISPDEGPRGAHRAEWVITPSDAPGFLDDLQQAGEGMIRLFTLAPELPGAIDFIAQGAAAGVVMSLGHHQASAGVIAQAVEAGARMCTHLGNGSHALLPRLDNYVQHQLAEDRLAAGLIPDGHHLPFATLKNFLRAKGIQRSVLVTDAVYLAEMPPGVYGHRELTAEGVVRLRGTPYLSGAALSLDRGVLNAAAHAGVSLEEAWAMASVQPAKLAGLAAPAPVEVEVTAEGFRRVG